MEQLLLPCVGSEAGVCFARSLRVVDDLEVAPEEASPCEHGDAPATLWDAVAKRRPVQLAGWRSRAVQDGSAARAALPVGLDEDPQLCDHLRRARCVTKGARRVRARGPRKRARETARPRRGPTFIEEQPGCS